MVALLVVFALFGTAIMLRLGYWQVGRPDLVARALATMETLDPVAPARADIVDRNGHVLAQTIMYDQLVAYPISIPEERRADVVATLAGILDLDAEEQAAYLAILSDEDREWASLKLRLTPGESALVAAAQEEGQLPGIGRQPNSARAYKSAQAHTTLASHLLGLVAGSSGAAGGVEAAYDARLSGAEAPPPDVASLAGAGVAGTGLLADEDILDGLSVPPLRLTIDRKLQQQVERTINHVRIQNDAVSVSAILMDPYTGAILASASSPAYDANQYGRVFLRQPELLPDRNITSMYEPGSVMKMFTAAAALQAGVVKLGTLIHDQQVLRFDEYEVNNFDGLSIGSAPVRDIIAQSRNVGTAKIAARLAPHNPQRAARILFDTWDRLGMVGPTGVDLADETAGWWYDPRDYRWAPVELANRSFGQGVSVTLMHLATGYAPFMNGGFRVQPHVVEDETGDEPVKERVLDAKVATQTRDLLTYVTGSVPTYANGALIPGHVVGGKTGTGQIWDPTRWNRDTHSRGDWKPNRFNSSFVGFVGSDEPEVLIAVRIEEAKPIDLEPLTLRIPSFELYHMVASSAIKVLDIPRAKDPLAGLPVPGTDAAQWSVFHDELIAARARAHERAQKQRDGGLQGAGSIGGPDAPGSVPSRRGKTARRDDDAETNRAATPGRRSGQGRQGGSPDTDT
jgi:cell division protein FtsI/penicillin-binding protein 2